MSNMSISERYLDIANRSGFSERVVRGVLKALRESIAESLTKSEKATVPGICTLTPSVRNRLMSNNNGEIVNESTIKIKATASNALTTEFEALRVEKGIAVNRYMGVDEINDDNTDLTKLLNIQDMYNSSGILTKQINALL